MSTSAAGRTHVDQLGILGVTRIRERLYKGLETSAAGRTCTLKTRRMSMDELILLSRSEK